MSMLAGPRRKQKVINLRAKNNAWSNDASKFGQRMLEKMGWTSGKGLGAKEDGIVQHVVARYKNDEKGLGFEDRNDQWTKHEDDFDALLANLSNANSDDEKIHSGISLEDKSKKSKARIHYHKFTRGKDLSRYSEKDIANIFGKKKLKEVEKEIKEITKEDCKTTEQIFTEKGSMTDYFKNKLATMQRRKPAKYKVLETEDSQHGFGYQLDVENNYQGFGFSAEKNDFSDNENTYAGFGFQPATLDISNDSQNLYNSREENSENSKKKKKTNKAEQYTHDTDISENKSHVNVFEGSDTHDIHLKKRKKKKLNENTHLEIQNEHTMHKLKTEDIKKKKKKSKKKNIDLEEREELVTDPCYQSNKSVLINNLNDSETQSTKKRKLKRKKNFEEGVLNVAEDVAPKKKKNKNR